MFTHIIILITTIADVNVVSATIMGRRININTRIRHILYPVRVRLPDTQATLVHGDIVLSQIFPILRSILAMIHLVPIVKFRKSLYKRRIPIAALVRALN